MNPIKVKYASRMFKFQSQIGDLVDFVASEELIYGIIITESGNIVVKKLEDIKVIKEVQE